MWLCLQGRTRITSHVLGPVTTLSVHWDFPQPPFLLPSASFCGKERMHISQLKKPIIFTTHA